MSKTWEEAIERYEGIRYTVACFTGSKKDCDAVDMAFSALRPVSREQVEKVWRVCNACEIPCNNCESIYAWDRYGKPQECTGCPENGYKNYTPESQFCEFCGRPLTDEAVQMVMERLEALKDAES